MLVLIPICLALYVIVHIVRSERKFDKETKAMFGSMDDWYNWP